MNRHLIILRKSVWVVLLAGVLACGEEPPPAPQPNTVSKKIAVQPAQPVTPATPAATPAPETAPSPLATPTPVVAPSPVAAPAPEAASSVTATPAAVAAPSPVAASKEPASVAEVAVEAGRPAPLPTPAAADASTLVKESMQLAAAYDPEGRFDPFEPLFKEQQAQTMPSGKDKHAKRAPQTPLEKVALAQLKVTAIIRAASGNRALVEDATGKGYVVQVGTYMGLNSGQVIRIDNDRLVVEEEIESVMGELTIENQELKLQKPAGEL